MIDKYGKTPAIILGKLHPLFQGLSWVSLATSDDETRSVLMAIRIVREGTKTTATATDGRRLHVHEFDAGMFDTDISEQMIESGLYMVATRSKSMIVLYDHDMEADKYPNVSAVVPTHDLRKEDTVNYQTVSKICMRSGGLFAHDFLAEACACKVIGESSDVEYWHGNPTERIKISHSLGYAVVMPLRFETDENGEEVAVTSKLGIQQEESE